ncbi:MAG: phosphotransferase [Clostridia bacterium]|nr:phosphotransferase [Clostridia bacterium]
MDINAVFALFGKGGAARAERYINSEDGGAYDVWRIVCESGEYVLKKAKGKETEIYREFFSQPVGGVPRFYGSANAGGDEYLLLSRERGEALLSVDKASAAAAVDALVSVQDRFWLDTSHAGRGTTYDESLRSRAGRGKYLADPLLERCYAEFLKIYGSLPRTLCHDDLLPFNVLYDGVRAVMVDWEHAGVLPYLTPLARFIAHCFEPGEEFFAMTESDKEFAKEYYYKKFVKEKGIDRAAFLRDLDYFVFYEYCEWVMLANKYPSSANDRNARYLDRARRLALKLSDE